MASVCSKCNQPAITYITYNGTFLCRDHLFQYVEKRVKKDLKTQGKTKNKTRIGVALSGGKDSSLCLYLLHTIFKQRPQVTLVGLTIDEGIQGYRDKSIPYAKKICHDLHVEHHIKAFKDVFSTTMDEIMQNNKNLGACSYCGVFRRVCLNQLSKELSIDKLATGHNLDDMAQSILMNFANSDMQKLARLGPHQKIQPGLVPRILPLRTIPEKETTMYCLLKGIGFAHDECPYAFQASRGEFRSILDHLEEKNPGTRHSIFNSYETIKPCLLQQYPPVPLNSCQQCGEPTTHELCKACELLKTL